MDRRFGLSAQRLRRLFLGDKEIVAANGQIGCALGEVFSSINEKGGKEGQRAERYADDLKRGSTASRSRKAPDVAKIFVPHFCAVEIVGIGSDS